MSAITPQHPQGLRPSTKADYLERMARLQNYLESHLDTEDLNPEELASVACMSRAHFHRVFRAMFGVTIMEHVRHLRLERAAVRLRFHATSSILEVALDAGYSSHEAFTRAFQAHLGLTPSSWRQTPGARIATAQPHIPVAPPDVRLKNFPPRHIATVRHWGDYLHISPAFESAITHAKSIGQTPHALIGVYHDDPEITATERLRADVGFECTNPGSIPAGLLQTSTLPAGVYATLVHQGPYETLSLGYLRLIGQWLPGSGYTLCAEGVVESYLNDPNTVAPSDILTEIQVRLMPWKAQS